MNFKLWMEGFIAAALTGAVTGAGQAIGNGGSVNKGTAIVAIGGALMGVLTYLKKPAPPKS